MNPDGTKRWAASLGLARLSEVVFDSSNNLYLSFASVRQIGGVASFSTSGGTNWVFEVNRPVMAPPAIASDGTIYFAGQNSKVYALNPDGTERWRFDSGSPVNSAPAVGPDGMLAFVAHDGRFRLLSDSGSLLFEKQLADQPGVSWVTYAPLGQWVIIAGSKVIALAPDGSDRWTTNLQHIRVDGTNSHFAAYVQGPPQVTTAGEIYLSAANGFIYMLSPEGESLRNTPKGWRGIPSAVNDFTLLPDGGLLVGFEETFSIPMSGGTTTFGTREAAIIQFNPMGNAITRVDLAGSFNPLGVFNLPSFSRNRRVGFGLREYQGLSRPIAGPDGTIYYTSFNELHALRSPQPEKVR